jgi:hypothetical protein
VNSRRVRGRAPAVLLDRGAVHGQVHHFRARVVQTGPNPGAPIEAGRFYGIILASQELLVQVSNTCFLLLTNQHVLTVFLKGR